MPNFADNPYVGPRTFTHQDSHRFFGRDREAQDLLSLVISERLALFYAPSGAGKSSLLNARLIPQLKAANFTVLPIARVSGALPLGIEQVDNIFVFNLLLSLERRSSDPQRFTRMPLTDFLARLTTTDGENYYCETEPVAPAAGGDGYEEIPYVLIIDQFEEIITAHPERWQEREAFFRQLHQAMHNDPLLWVVLSLREDYVAALDPYAPLLPNGLRGRFHMQRLDYEAALEAVIKPAELSGRPFAAGVAETLVGNLRQIRLHGQPKLQPGQFIEPVQLQVVCYQLWENLKKRAIKEITQADLPLDYIDRALIQFYEAAISHVARQTRETEFSLRAWFQNELITEAGTRGTVYRGHKTTGGLDNRAADLLVERFLLRNEMRAGGVWYELTHDRFIPPILKSNAERQIGRLKRQSGLSTGLLTFMLVALAIGLMSKLLQERKFWLRRR